MYAPIEKEYIRENESLFTIKSMYKEIMKRLRGRNMYLKSKSLTDRKDYNIRRSYCKKLLRTTKNEYTNKLDTKKLNENRMFLRTTVTILLK